MASSYYFHLKCSFQIHKKLSMKISINYISNKVYAVLFGIQNYYKLEKLTARIFLRCYSFTKV